MEDYCWHYHHDDEVFSIGRLFYPVRPPHISVTPTMLLDFANKGKWEYDYPEYTFPKIRYYVYIDRFIFGLLITGLTLIVIKSTFLN